MDMILTMTDVHPRDRLAYWYDVACKCFVDHECEIANPSAVSVTLHNAQLGEIGFSTIESGGLQSVRRTPRNIANSEDDVFLFSLQLSGTSTIRQDGREAVLRPGDFALIDTQRPYSAHPGEAQELVLKIPHRALKARLPASSDLTARTVRHAAGIGGLVSGYLSMLPSHIDALQSAGKIQVGEQVLDQIALALAADAGEERPALSSGRAVALLHVRMAIESHLSDPALDPAMAAALAGISVRYANHLLSEQGTSLERLIVSRRLERCRRALEDPAQAHRTVSEIAYAWGFSDPSHFNRRFKAENGCAPREYRQRFRS
jgi:AraC family transcriptional regulator, positive regulator of tynA and feaB